MEAELTRNHFIEKQFRTTKISENILLVEKKFGKLQSLFIQ